MSRKSPEWPTISEKQWYALALSSAILAVIAFLASFVAVFLEGRSPEDAQRLAATLAPFGVAYGAFVTFCTVAWRGSISARQADQSEREGRARLLQEGAKLIADTDKPAHVTAGVATLGVLVLGNDESFALEAMNLLIDFVSDHMANDHTNRHREEISAVLLNGERRGLNTGRTLTFQSREDDNFYGEDGYYELTRWHYIPGLKEIRIRDGAFLFDENYNLEEIRNISFSRCEIVGWSQLEVDDRFFSCQFVDCSIRAVSSWDALSPHGHHLLAFRNCNFSNAKISIDQLVKLRLFESENYYIAGQSPSLVGSEQPVEWSSVFKLVNQKPSPTHPW